MSTKKSAAIKFLDELSGESLTFGQMIEALRKSDEISQVELARRMKISRARLCDIEKGRRSVKPAQAAQFARVMGYHPAHFVAQALEDQVREAGLKLRVTVEAA